MPTVNQITRDVKLSGLPLSLAAVEIGITPVHRDLLHKALCSGDKELLKQSEQLVLAHVALEAYNPEKRVSPDLRNAYGEICHDLHGQVQQRAEHLADALDRFSPPAEAPTTTELSSRARKFTEAAPAAMLGRIAGLKKFATPEERSSAQVLGLNLEPSSFIDPGREGPAIGRVVTGRALIEDRLFVTHFNLPVGSDLTSLEQDACIFLYASRLGVPVPKLRKNVAVAPIPDFGVVHAGCADYLVYSQNGRLPTPIDCKIIGWEKVTQNDESIILQRTLDGLYRVSTDGLFRVRVTRNPGQHLLPKKVVRLIKTNMPRLKFGIDPFIASCISKSETQKDPHSIALALIEYGLQYTLDPILPPLLRNAGKHALTIVATSGAGSCGHFAFLNAAASCSVGRLTVIAKGYCLHKGPENQIKPPLHDYNLATHRSGTYRQDLTKHTRNPIALSATSLQAACPNEMAALERGELDDASASRIGKAIKEDCAIPIDPAEEGHTLSDELFPSRDRQQARLAQALRWFTRQIGGAIDDGSGRPCVQKLLIIHKECIELWQDLNACEGKSKEAMDILYQTFRAAILSPHIKFSEKIMLLAGAGQDIATMTANQKCALDYLPAIEALWDMTESLVENERIEAHQVLIASTTEVLSQAMSNYPAATPLLTILTRNLALRPDAYAPSAVMSYACKLCSVVDAAEESHRDSGAAGDSPVLHFIRATLGLDGASGAKFLTEELAIRGRGSDPPYALLKIPDLKKHIGDKRISAEFNAVLCEYLDKALSWDEPKNAFGFIHLSNLPGIEAKLYDTGAKLDLRLLRGRIIETELSFLPDRSCFLQEHGLAARVLIEGSLNDKEHVLSNSRLIDWVVQRNGLTIEDLGTRLAEDPEKFAESFLTPGKNGLFKRVHTSDGNLAFFCPKGLWVLDRAETVALFCALKDSRIPEVRQILQVCAPFLNATTHNHQAFVEYLTERPALLAEVENHLQKLPPRDLALVVERTTREVIARNSSCSQSLEGLADLTLLRHHFMHSNPAKASLSDFNLAQASTHGFAGRSNSSFVRTLALKSVAYATAFDRSLEVTYSVAPLVHARASSKKGFGALAGEPIDAKVIREFLARDMSLQAPDSAMIGQAIRATESQSWIKRTMTRESHREETVQGSKIIPTRGIPTIRRRYIRGDPPRSIDWRATAKSPHNEVITKLELVSSPKERRERAYIITSLPCLLGNTPEQTRMRMVAALAILNEYTKQGCGVTCGLYAADTFLQSITLSNDQRPRSTWSTATRLLRTCASSVENPANAKKLFGVFSGFPGLLGFCPPSHLPADCVIAVVATRTVAQICKLQVPKDVAGALMVHELPERRA